MPLNTKWHTCIKIGFLKEKNFSLTNDDGINFAFHLHRAVDALENVNRVFPFRLVDDNAFVADVMFLKRGRIFETEKFSLFLLQKNSLLACYW